MIAMQITLTDTIRFRPIIAATLSSQLFIFLAGCAHSVDDVSKIPPPEQKAPSKVLAPLNEDLKNAQLKNLNMRAKLFLDDSDEYDMDINNGTATWENADLPAQSPYDLTVQFEIEVSGNPGVYLVAAQTKATHDFSTETTKTFQANDLASDFDEDDDSMSNLAEFLVDGNPVNPAPTLLNAAQITVLENGTEVLTVQAISPRSALVTYSIVTNDNDLFVIDTQTGLLGFNTPITYDINNNQYSVTILADDGSFTAQQTITVTVTDVFDLKYDIGLKQLQFHWSAAPGTSYYKILQSGDAGSTFTELPDSGNITSLNYNHSLALHLFDQAKTWFKLQAYDSNNTIINESQAINMAAGLESAIGYIKSTFTRTGNHFGEEITISADGNTMVVGAPGENGSAGAIHVFSNATGAWKSQGSVNAPNNEADDRFGSAIAISANGNTMVVGAYGEDSSANGVNDATVGQTNNGALDAGAVYVFDRISNSEAFIFRDYIKASNSDAYDQFGRAIALSADGTILVVGAPREASAARGVNDTVVDQSNNSAFEAGAAYVFSRNSTIASFVPQDYIKAPNSDASDWFGSAIGLSTDGNILVVGATKEASAARGVNDTTLGQTDNSATNSGAVYMFSRASYNESYTFMDYIKAPNSETDDFFGSAVALSADGNTLVVGAYGEDSAASGVNDTTLGQVDNTASNSGAVYSLGRASNAEAFTFQDYIKASNSETDDYFGSAVAISADGNTLVVGAYGEDSAASSVNDTTLGQVDNSALNAGSVYVFILASNAVAFIQKAYVKAPNSEAFDQYGDAVALSNDGNTLFVGAPNEDSSASGINDSTVDQTDNFTSSSGAVYMY